MSVLNETTQVLQSEKVPRKKMKGSKSQIMTGKLLTDLQEKQKQFYEKLMNENNQYAAKATLNEKPTNVWMDSLRNTSQRDSQKKLNDA